MKIVHIATTDIKGGASRSAYRLHEGLLAIGQHSSMLVYEKYSRDQAVVPFDLNLPFFDRAGRMLRRRYLNASSPDLSKRPAGASFFSDDRTQFRAAFLDQLPETDVLNLHWIAGFVDYPALLARLPATLPVVWTLHDMNPFTGGCHFDGGCGKFTQQCGACPELGTTEQKDFSYRSLGRKARALRRLSDRSIRVVAPSSWMATTARSSSLFGNLPISVIPYGIDTELFKPVDRDSARRRFGIQYEAKVVLFVADYLSEARKGLAQLIEAARAASEQVPEAVFVAVGHRLGTATLGPNFLAVGHVSDDETLRDLYGAADVFAISSLQDNLPNTALEALACGVPTVAFSVGGLKDIVSPGRTGELVDRGNVAGLCQAMVKLLQNNELRLQMGAESRLRAEMEYTLKLQARRYLDLYSSLA